MPLFNADGSQPLEKLSGIVNRITFHSVETGYSVLKVGSFERPKEEVTVLIYQSKVFAGATLDFFGEWMAHPTYGRQFKAVRVAERKPATAHALEKYLGSGLIKGVGPATAKKIVRHFGDKTLPVFESEIERLTEVPGIAEAKLEMIRQAWSEHQEIRHVMLFLQSHQLSTLFAVKIYKTYGNDAIDIVTKNPYRLAQDIYGIGFFSADKVALSQGLKTNSPERLQAGVRHVLQSAREEGHCYLTHTQVTVGVGELLSLQSNEAIDPVLLDLEQKGELKTRMLPAGDGALQKCFYANSLYFDEQYIAVKAQQLLAIPVSVNKETLQDQLDHYNRFHRLTLSDEQHEAVLQIAAERLSILTGGPGCGKTTTTRALVGLLQRLGRKVLLAAPTGRAAQRMIDVIGLESKTIHRLLEWDAGKGGFKRNQQSPLDADVLILDETSMLDVHLAAAVLRAVSIDMQVVMIGDADQLPAVGAGNVLQDLIASGTVPCHKLTKIFRQAAQSLIISSAHQINKGEVPRIESPFHKPQVWKEGVDCLFIDSEEATQEQLRFINKVKRLSIDPQEQSMAAEQETLYTTENSLAIPAKYAHVDIDALLKAQTHTEELRQVLRRIHPWSSLHYGLSATAMVEKLYSDTIPKYLGKNVELQILSPMTKGSLGTASLNQLIQAKLNAPAPGKAQVMVGGRVFRVGDRVIQKRNNYDLGVFNGDIGTVGDVDNETMEMVVRFAAGKESKEVCYGKEDLLELDLAYAITIHKAQGSEFEAVVIPIVSQHFNLLFRNLVYTGITRAKKLVVFVGTRKALAMAVQKQTTSERQTALAYLLKQKIN